MRIAVFTTCLVDGLFPHAAVATVRLLERLGHEVAVPSGQACCGQMHVNSGYPRQAVPVVRNHVRTFWPVVEGEWDAVVAPSGSCVGSARHQHARVAQGAGDAGLARAAEEVAARTYELSELLVDVLGVTDVGAWFPHTVTFHPTCHSLRMLRVGDRPTRLLRAVEGLRLVDLPDADQCCGFGGTFAMTNSATSSAMVADKADCVVATGAEVVTAGDWSCLMNIDGALSRGGAPVRSVHLAEILASTRDEPWEPPGTGRGAGRASRRSSPVAAGPRAGARVR